MPAQIFDKVIIKLKRPICNCPQNRLAWGIELDQYEKPFLILTCKECYTKLTIPYAEFLGIIQIDKPSQSCAEVKPEALKITEDDKKFLSTLNIRAD